MGSEPDQDQGEARISADAWDNEPTIVGGPRLSDAAATRRRMRGEELPVTATPLPVPGDSARPSFDVVVGNEAPLSAAVIEATVFEIWTRHRMYGLNARMDCVEVTDLGAGQRDEGHALLGARLVGGQLGPDGPLLLPLPVEGANAVFKRTSADGRVRLSDTSPVTRVVVRIVRASIAGRSTDDAWATVIRARTEK